MERARLGDKVRVHYTGTLPDGTEFDTSRGRGALEFIIGRKQVILGFERAVLGMAPNTMKIENIPSNQAFGPVRRELIVKLDTGALDADGIPSLGEQVKVRTADGKSRTGVVTNVSESSVTVDANHPLAGQDLTFEIQLIQIVDSEGRLDQALERAPKGARESKIILPR
jgi:FKBP-type peptidyl-prolyl cis-trans isomerase 2